MGLDLRLPIGLLFAIIGVLLAGYGLVADRAIYARSLGYNVNLAWGIVLLIFGLITLWLGRKGVPTMRTSEATPEGLATERHEQRTGLEEG